MGEQLPGEQTQPEGESRLIPCPRCGKKLPSNSNYCGYCREPLKEGISRLDEENKERIEE